MQAPAQGPAPASSPAPAPAPGGGLAARYAARGRPGAEGAGAILALFLYPLLVNALRGGPQQAIGWLGAKFINQPYQHGATHGAKPGKPEPAPPPLRRPGPFPVPRP